MAIDAVGAGEGQLVLVVQGSSARMTEQTKNLPADAVIVGIIDSAEFGGKTFYQARMRLVARVSCPCWRFTGRQPCTRAS